MRNKTEEKYEVHECGNIFNDFAIGSSENNN